MSRFLAELAEIEDARERYGRRNDKKYIFLGMLLLIFLLLSNIGFAWANDSYIYKQNWNFTNDLANARTNASVIFNISTTHTKADCTDIIFYNCTEDGMFTNYNIINTVGNCTVKLYDNWTSTGTNCYYAYYDNATMDNSGLWKSASYELTWLYNSSLGVAQFNQTKCDGSGGSCIIGSKTVDGQEGVTFRTTSSSGCGTIYYNITDWFTQNGGNIGDNCILTANITKESVSTTEWDNGRIVLEMNETGLSGYENLAFAGDSGNYYIRNFTAGSYETAHKIASSVSAGVYYYRQFNISNGNACGQFTNSSGTYNYCVLYNSSFTGKPAGIGGYASCANWAAGTNLTFKAMKGGTFMTNRNVTETSGSETANVAETENHIVLNAPSNGGSSTSYTIKFNYTPTIMNGNYENCTLFGNFSGTYAKNNSNSSAITNESLNTISNTMNDDKAYLWDVRCYNSSTEYFESPSNYTVTVNVLKTLLWSYYNPSAESIFYTNKNFTFNGSVNCTTGSCGNINVYAFYSSSTAPNSFTDDTNDEFYNGSFGNAPNQMTMNYSNAITLFPDMTKWIKSPNNPTLTDTIGWESIYHIMGAGWYNSTKGIYYILYSGANDTNGRYAQIGICNTTDMTLACTNKSILLSYNVSNSWEAYPRVYPTSVVYNSANNYYHMWIGGLNSGGKTTFGYANCSASTDCSIGSNWQKFDNGNPVVTSSGICEHASDDAFNMKVWLENNTYYATFLCDFAGGGSSYYKIYLINSTNGITWNVMNSGNYIMIASDIGCGEIQNNGIIALKYNSTNNIYLQVTGFSIGKGYGNGGANVLAYSFNKINWYYWNSGAVVIDIGNSSQFDNYRSGLEDWTFQNGNKIYQAYAGLNTSGSTTWKVGVATANYTSGYYTSSVKTGTSNLTNWTSLNWANTTCNGCSVKLQLGTSNDSSTWTWSSNYTTNVSLNLLGKYAKYIIYLTGNNTDTPSVSSVSLGDLDQGNAAMNSSTPLQTVNPFNCGILNTTNKNCDWTFNVNATQEGTYNISVIANSSLISNTSTLLMIYVFPLPNASLTLSNNLSWAGNYNASSSTTGGGCTSGLTCNLFRNGSSVSNPDNAVLGAGNWIYIFNTSGNENYSATTVSNTLIMSKGTPPLSITYNISLPTSPSTAVKATCSAPAEITTSLFFSDGGIVSNPYEFTTGGVGSIYNFTCNTTGNANYSAYSTNSSLTVDIPGALSIDGVYDENNVSKAITFDVELFNATYSNKTTNITSYYNNVVTGLVTIRISSAESNSAGFCSGTALNCTNFSTEYSCYYQQGCHWLGNSTDGNCSQTPTPCSAFLSSSICYQQSGCSWTDTTLSSYGTRYYYMDIPANSGTHNLTAYLVNSSVGHTVSFTIFNRNENPIENANITISRLLPTWKVVGARFTDSAGATTFFADNSANYKIYVTKSGYDDKEVSLPLTESSYKIYLTGIGYTGNYTPGIWENISYYVSPSGGVLQNGTQIFNFTINSTDSKLQYWGMNVTHGNGTVLCSLNYTTAFGGIAACSLNLSNESGQNITVTTWFKKTGFALWTDPIFEKIQSWQNSGLYKILSDLGALEPVALGVFAIIIAIMVAGVGTTSLPYGTKIGSGVIMLAVFAILIYGVESINGVGYLWSWGIWIVTAITIGAYYYLKGGW